MRFEDVREGSVVRVAATGVLLACTVKDERARVLWLEREAGKGRFFTARSFEEGGFISNHRDMEARSGIGKDAA